LPHYPELGWNVNPNQQPEHEPEVIFEEEVQDNMQEPVEEMVVDSIVLNPSNASAAQQLAGEEFNQNVHLGHNHLQVGFVRTFFGPALP
jgi:hypothetical protein